MNIIFIILITIVSSIEFFGDASFKIFARTNNYSILAGGIFMYLLMILVIITILKYYSNVLYMNTMWDGVSTLIEGMLAVLILGESLRNNYQIAGFFVILSGIILLNIGTVPY